ncbi:hypothetical protein M0G74_01810 [Microbulbifer sp. CAU 1566]|uniref:hypothetical protein n=1 Tax=Microbulbifer sp. CAU 1566 TaxID=2933269 RepID=UPI00200550ED|nr:hypothetical protein [Microbulbifer sp. CAU 1566]MCK7596002.1 hypothetical protein [Microbulbifer sp. CAU 1566]
MNIFTYVINFVLLLVALAITLMLGDLVRAFRERQLISLHWLVPVWVLLIIAWQFQLLWGAFELHKLQKDWTALEFGLLIGLTLILCVACRLIVPGRAVQESLGVQSHDSAESAFERFRFNGKWAIACLAIYFFCAYLINIFLFDLGIYNPNNVEDLALAVLLVLLICSKKPSYWILGTALFALASVVGIVVLSPAHYAN